MTSPEHHYREEPSTTEQVQGLLDVLDEISIAPTTNTSYMLTRTYTLSRYEGPLTRALGKELVAPPLVGNHFYNINSDQSPLQDNMHTDSDITFSGISYLDSDGSRDNLDVLGQFQFSREGEIMPFGHLSNELRYDLIRDPSTGLLRAVRDFALNYVSLNGSLDTYNVSHEVRSQRIADRDTKGLVREDIALEGYEYAEATETEHGFNEVSAEEAQQLIDFIRKIKTSKQHRALL